MATEVSICSNALLLLGGKPISSLAESEPRATTAASLWPTVRDGVLRSHPWNCAVKRVVLSPEVTPPAFGYTYQFLLPGDCLRILEVGDNDQTDYRKEGGSLLCDEATLKLRYVYRNTNPANYDALLITALEMAMAARMAYAITESASVASEMAARYEQTMRSARAVDGQEDPPETLGNFRFAASRY